MTNTDGDIFLDDAAQQYYVLLSGRWFRAKSMEGPWSYAGGDLPKNFAKIPEDSKKASVLASVPGTVQASDAVLLAQIPTTVTVNRAEAEAKVKVASGQGRNPQSVSPSTMDGLNRSAESRQRGQMQTQRFQNFHRRGGGGRFRR